MRTNRTIHFTNHHMNDFIFGTQPIIEAINNNASIDKIFIKKGKHSENLSKLIKERKIPYQQVPLEKLNRITRKNHQGVIAFLSAIDFYKIEDVLPEIYEAGELPAIAILDGITDVRNVGAIARTCYAAGIHTIIIPSKNFARIGPDAIKTSAGALLKMKVCREQDLKKTVIFLQENGIQVVAASEKAVDAYYKLDYTGPTAFVMGAEDKGVSQSIIKTADYLVKIPMKNDFDSLNVSVATGILIFELVKQRLS